MSGLPAVPQIRFNPQASLSTLEFWWQAPLDNGGALIQNYTLLCSSISYSTIIGPSSFYAKVNPLVNSQDYTFQLAASNTNGLGPYIAFTTAQPGIRPAGITNLAVSTLSASSANVVWNFTQNAQESGNHYFIMTVIPSTQTAQISTFQIPIYPNQRSQIVSNISTTNYTFLVQSINDANYSFPNVSTLKLISLAIPALVYLTASTYSGSGTWNDSSGNGKNATLSEGSIAKNAAGNGIVLNGSTCWTFSNIALGNAWSFSVWFKPTSIATWGPEACILTQIFSGSRLASFSLANVTGSSNIRTIIWNVNPYVSSNVPISDGQWINYQVTWNGTNIITYVNGAFVNSTALSITSLDSGLAWRIGRRWDSADFVKGDIGEVSIYGSVLTPTQVSNLYTTTASSYTT